MPAREGVTACLLHNDPASETQNFAAIEALLARRPVLLSDIPAHRELKRLVPDLLLFDAGDFASFEKGTSALAEQWIDHDLRARLQANARQFFGRQVFDARVTQWLESATR